MASHEYIDVYIFVPKPTQWCFERKWEGLIKQFVEKKSITVK